MNHQNKHLAEYRVKCSLLVIAIWILPSAIASAADVGLSLRIGQPGFYGEIYLGDFYPVPDLIYPDPVIIYTPPNIVQQPLYLHVPHKHVKNWRRFCIQYRACDRPVYFVREHWYNDIYIPYYSQHGHTPQLQRHKNHPRRDHDAYKRHDHDHRKKDKDFRHGDGKHDRHNPHDRGHGRKHDD